MSIVAFVVLVIYLGVGMMIRDLLFEIVEHAHLGCYAVGAPYILTIDRRQRELLLVVIDVSDPQSTPVS